MEQLHKILAFTDLIMISLLEAYHQLAGYGQAKTSTPQGGTATIE